MFDFNVREIGLNNLKLNLFKPDDSLTFSNIVLKASLSGREKTYSALIQGLNFRSSDKRFNLLSADGNITLTGNRLMFQDVEIITVVKGVLRHARSLVIARGVRAPSRGDDLKFQPD